jgi:hypothetical protein
MVIQETVHLSPNATIIYFQPMEEDIHILFKILARNNNTNYLPLGTHVD